MLVARTVWNNFSLFSHVSQVIFFPSCFPRLAGLAGWPTLTSCFSTLEWGLGLSFDPLSVPGMASIASIPTQAKGRLEWATRPGENFFD